MDTLIVQVLGRGARGPALVRGTGQLLRLGRGFANEIVLDDPFVAAEQLRFVRGDAGWQVEILDRTNAVLLNGEAVTDDVCAIRSGDHLTVGRTDLAVYAEDHAVEPPRRLVFSSWLATHRIGPVLALGTLVLFCVLDAALEYGFQSTDLEWRKYAFSAFFSAVFVGGWAALWAIVGRALRHQPHYFVHLLVSSWVMLGTTCLLPLAAVAAFTSNRAEVGEVAVYVVAVVSLSVLLGFNLFFATNLRHTARVALGVSVLLAGLHYVSNSYEEDEFQARAYYPRTVLPPFLHVTGEKSIEDFIAGVKAPPAEAEETGS